jgi:hypothetical protein
MRDWSAIRERYLRDALPVRLGGLAANLARGRSFADHPNHWGVVERLLEESKFFIEWTAPDAGINSQAKLVDLQIQLAHWQHIWKRIWDDPARRAGIAEEPGVWSQRVLEISGLLG